MVGRVRERFGNDQRRWGRRSTRLGSKAGGHAVSPVKPVHEMPRGLGGTVLKWLVLGDEAWESELVGALLWRGSGADKATTARLGSAKTKGEGHGMWRPRSC
jgi:hypothetical protein